MPLDTLPTTDEQEVLARNDVNVLPSSRGRLAMPEEMDIKNGNPRFRTQDALDRHLGKNNDLRWRRAEDGTHLDVLNTGHREEPLSLNKRSLDSAGKPELSSELYRLLGEEPVSPSPRIQHGRLQDTFDAMRDTHPTALLILFLYYEDGLTHEQIATATFLSEPSIRRILKASLEYVRHEYYAHQILDSQG